MSSTRDKSFEQYAKKCRELKRDIEHVLGDLKFIREQGGTIRYAVDDAEIIAYAYPKDTAHRIRLFADDPESWTNFLHRLALRRLFDDLSEKLILLKPYAMDLSHFLKHKEEILIVEVIEEAAGMRKEQEKLIGDPEFKEVMKPFEKAEGENGENAATSGQYRRLFDYLQKNAPSLLGSDDQLSTRPLGRIRKLFENNRLEDLKCLEDLEYLEEKIDTKFDDSKVHSWYEKLVEQRKQATKRNQYTGSDNEEIRNNNYEEFVKELQRDNLWRNSLYDAAAIATVKQANDILQDREMKLLLVTRSWNMHELFEGQPDDSPLRHPRTFSVLFRDDIMTDEEDNDRQQLEDLSENIDLFLNAVEEYESDSTTVEGSDTEDQLNELLSKIEEDWRSIGALKASLYEAESRDETSWKRSPEKIQRILGILRDGDKAIHDFLRERLNELAYDLGGDHALLGMYAQTGDQEQQKRLSNHLVAEKLDGKFVLKTELLQKLQNIPYWIEFYSLETEELLDEFFSRDLSLQEKERRWSNVLSSCLKKASLDDKYEPLLVMAYVLGALEQWKLAEMYCERAIEVADRVSASPNEAKFFLAICKGKSSPSAERLKEAIELIDQAVDLKAGREGEDRSEDPRYLKEKATHILRLNTEYLAEDDGEFPEPSKGLELLDLAEKACEDDKDGLILRVQILNNRLYYFVERGQIGEEAKEVFRALSQLHHEFEPDESKWPALVKDTIAWAEWNLYGGEGGGRKKSDIERLLKQAADSPDIEGRAKEFIQEHLKEIEQGRRGLDWAAERAKSPVAGDKALS